MPYKRSGGKQCSAVGCTNSQKKLYEWENAECKQHDMIQKDCPCLVPFKFHYMPKNEEKRRMWIKAINRKDFNPASQTVVCSCHFVDGKPSKENPYPSQQMGYIPMKATPVRRPLVRKALDLNTPSKQSYGKAIKEDSTHTNDEPEFLATPLPQLNEECESTCCTLNPEICKNRPTLVDASTQTVDVVLLDHNYWYSKPTRNVSCQHSTNEFAFESISSDSDAMFYTGLNMTVLFCLMKNLAKFGKNLPYKIPVTDQILSVLVRLRLGITLSDLARRLNISSQLMGSIFNSWIKIMSKQMSDCIIWLPRETLRRTLPSSFFESYPKTTCIIDCTEIFMQRPFSLKARAQTWSTYKSHNTAKFLIAIAPNGYIMYVSPLYGGRASDNFITKDCGFLDYLLPGDEVMADRGFTLSEEMWARQVKLNIPAFMKGRKQLTETEVVETRRIASVRIHVERAIMRMKSYRMLNTKMSIKSAKKMNEIVSVVAALCNMRDPLIRESEIEMFREHQYMHPVFTDSAKARKNHISFATQLEKPLSKGGPYPTVVPLPTPSAVKKVPLQATRHTPPSQDFKDFNLPNPYKDGPTLVKSPPKLRPSSPIINSTVAMPRLAPIKRPATKPPAYSVHDTDGAGPTGPGDSERYMVQNREFDGRAVDPKTGRMYEYNTTTNERRWLDPGHPPSTRATLRRDDDNDLYMSSSES